MGAGQPSRGAAQVVVIALTIFPPSLVDSFRFQFLDRPIQPDEHAPMDLIRFGGQVS